MICLTFATILPALLLLVLKIRKKVILKLNTQKKFRLTDGIDSHNPLSKVMGGCLVCLFDSRQRLGRFSLVSEDEQGKNLPRYS